jgi:hypothetical protein
VWRRAHARAWKTPPREVALLRLARADSLGLSYRDYTSVLMDRGARLAAILLAPGVVDPARPDPTVKHRLAALAPGKLLICLATAGPMDAWLRQQVADLAVAVDPAPEALAATIEGLLERQSLTASSVCMVGNRPEHRQAAECLGLGLYKEAVDYFGPTTAAILSPTLPVAPTVQAPPARQLRWRAVGGTLPGPAWGKPGR